MFYVFALFFLLLLQGCQPTSLSDFQHEGEARCRKIAEALAPVENREQLVQVEPLLQKSFDSLVDLIIQARLFQEAHSQEVQPPFHISEASLQLEEELKRVYTFEGGRELIERSQQEALIKLDAFERSLARKKLRISR